MTTSRPAPCRSAAWPGTSTPASTHVEVQVDGGEWTRAELGGVPSVDTWVQWAVTIDVPEGDHEVRVRATGKDGETQTSVVRSPDPDGATGWHAVEFSAG